MNKESIKAGSVEHPLVSIVVPTYNHADYIADCLQSIMNQDYPHIELIVINDGSTDGTDHVIKEFLQKKPLRFHYISKENEGLIRTLNLGLQLAKGDFFCELASDDMLLPGSIQKRVEFLKATPDIDAVFADGYLLNGNEKTTIRVSRGKLRFNSSKHTIKDIIQGKARIFFPSGMFRRSILLKLGGFDEDFRYFEDVAIQYTLALNAKIGYLDKPVMYYRRHSTNTSFHKQYVRKEKILALEKLYSLRRDDLQRLIKKYLYKEYLKLIKYSFNQPLDKKDVIQAYQKSLNTYPLAIKARYYMVLLKIKGFS